MSIFGGLLIAFRRRRRAAGAVDDRHVLISALGVLAGPGLPDFAGSTRRTADERDQQERRDVRRALRRAAADADRERDLGLGDPLAPMMARQSAAVLGVRSDGAVSGPEYERLVDRRRRELLISDQAVDRAEAAARSRRRRRQR